MSLKKIKTADNFVTEKIDVHQNALLGDYDQEGNYVINPKIIEELLSMKKIKKSTYNNSMFCVSNNLGVGELVFEIHYNKKVVNGFASCELFLLENIYKVNGYYSNTLRTKIGEYQESVKGFIDKTYKFFNVTLHDEDDGREEKVDFKNLPFPYILAKKQYENAVFKNIEENIYEAYDIFLRDKLETLMTESNEFSNIVIDGYNQELKDIKDRFLTADRDDNAKAKNELLDAVVEKNLDDPTIQKDQIDKYSSKIEKSTEALNESYNESLQNNEKKIKKQLLKDEYSRVQEIKDDLALHNSQKSLEKGNKSFVLDEVKPEKAKENTKKDLGLVAEQENYVKNKENKKESNGPSRQDILMEQLREDIRKDKELIEKQNFEIEQAREDAEIARNETDQLRESYEDMSENIQEDKEKENQEEIDSVLINGAINVVDKAFGVNTKEILERQKEKIIDFASEVVSDIVDNTVSHAENTILRQLDDVVNSMEK